MRSLKSEQGGIEYKCFGMIGAIDRSKGIHVVPITSGTDKQTAESRASDEIIRKANESCSKIGGAMFGSYSRFGQLRLKMWRHFSPTDMGVYMERYGVTHFRALKALTEISTAPPPFLYTGRCYHEYREDKRILLFPDNCRTPLPYLCEKSKSEDWHNQKATFHIKI